VRTVKGGSISQYGGEIDRRGQREPRTTRGAVYCHLKNVFSKLHVNDRTAALNIALKHGIVQPR
jgi:hypothetical protein